MYCTAFEKWCTLLKVACWLEICWKLVRSLLELCLTIQKRTENNCNKQNKLPKMHVSGKENKIKALCIWMLHLILFIWIIFLDCFFNKFFFVFISCWVWSIIKCMVFYLILKKFLIYYLILKKLFALFNFEKIYYLILKKMFEFLFCFE